jgi:DnaK suppressor protein
MTREELEEQKLLIEEKIREIKESCGYLLEETKPIEPSVGLGRLTRMEAISEKGINEHILSENRKMLERLNNALDRIKKGTYGVCIRCGNDIPAARLKLVPEALICVPCLEKKKR